MMMLLILNYNKHTNLMDDCIPYTGYDFNEIFGCLEFIKITGTDEKENYSYPLHTGLNEIKFTENNGYIAGGIKFYESENMFQQINALYNATYIRYLQIPDDSNVVSKKECYMSDRILLLEKQLISELEIWNHPNLYKEHVMTYPKLAKYVKNMPSDISLQLLSKDITIIEHIENPTEEMCCIAVMKQPSLIHRIKNPTMPVYKALIGKFAYAINYITPASHDVIFELIDHNPEILKYLNNNDEVKEMAVHKNGLLLQHITNKTTKICDIAFKNNPGAIKFIPQNLRTRDMCINAVLHDHTLFDMVPQKFMDNDLCLFVLFKDPHLIEKINNPSDEMYLECSEAIPSLLGKIKDVSLIKDVDPLVILKLNPYHIKNIINPTYEMYFEAVSRVGQLLKLVPHALQDEMLCLAAVQNDGTSIEYIPTEHQTENICIKAIHQNINSFQYIINKTHTVCEYVLRSDYCCISKIQYIIEDNDFLEKMKLMCVSNDGLSLEFINDPTLDMCLYAIDQNYLAFKFVPKIFATDEVINFALSKNGLAIKYVVQQTELICIKAIKNNPLAIEFVNEKFLTDILCKEAIKKDYTCLSKIKKQPIEICLMAVKIDEKAIKHIHNLTKELCIHLWCINHKVTPHIKIAYLKNQCITMEQEFVSRYIK